MSDPRRELISFKELAELLIRERGIHEGTWGIYARFGIVALNAVVEPPGEPQPAKLTPSALVPLLELGIQQYPQPNEFTIDAAEVNPAPKAAKEGASKKRVKGKTKA